jgi:hypothetical protein
MGKLNTKLNMNTARHSRTDGLTKKVNRTIQTLLRCYFAKPGFDWTSPLSMAEFYYNCSNNEATTHSPFEVIWISTVYSSGSSFTNGQCYGICSC